MAAKWPKVRTVSSKINATEYQGCAETKMPCGHVIVEYMVSTDPDAAERGAKIYTETRAKGHQKVHRC